MVFVMKQTPNKIPQHVAIIPDGNRRWAKQNGLPSLEGHRRGMQQLEKVAQAARDMGIPSLTVWGLSTENLLREKEEVKYLNKIILTALERMAGQAKKKDIRVRHLGRKDRLPSEVLEKLRSLEEQTKDCTTYNLNIALDYGGRDEIIRAFKTLIDQQIPSSEITEDVISNAMDTHGLPDPDFIIRTSGEQRLSGLLPWQSVYAEYYFSPLYMPDFDPEQFRLAIEEFSRRQRRYGR